MRFTHAILAVLVLGLPLSAPATFPGFDWTFQVDCDAGKTISRALRFAGDGDTILVKGTCTETLVLDKGVTLDGGGTASLAPADPADRTISVAARNVTIRGFSFESPAQFQIFVSDAATVTIESNTIRNAANFGVNGAANAYLTLLGNTISDNGLGGVIGLSGAEFSIGVVTAFDPPQPNTIANNGTFGIVLASGAGARVLGGNTISGNPLGIVVQDGAQARIAGNVIDGNNIGIFSDFGGTVQLARETGVPAFAALNSGVNATFGIACKGGSIQGVADLQPAVALPPLPGTLGGATTGLATFCFDQTQPEL